MVTSKGSALTGVLWRGDKSTIICNEIQLPIKRQLSAFLISCQYLLKFLAACNSNMIKFHASMVSSLLCMIWIAALGANLVHVLAKVHCDRAMDTGLVVYE